MEIRRALTLWSAVVLAAAIAGCAGSRGAAREEVWPMWRAESVGEVRAALAKTRERMELVAVNMANADTVGYRRSWTWPIARAGGPGRVQEQGSAMMTGRSLDLMIVGEGFFRLRHQRTGKDVYVRAGNFEVNQNGELVMGEGWRIDPPLTLPPNVTKVDISDDGRVFGVMAGATATAEFGRIQLARFARPEALASVDGVHFTETEASGVQTIGNPASDAMGSLRQGFLEKGNVDPVFELVTLMELQRSMERLEQAQRILER